MVAGKVDPGIGRLHRKRTFGRGHDEPLVRHELDYFVGVTERPTQETGDKVETGANGQRLVGLPRDALDIGVPVRGAVGISDIGSDLMAWSADVDHGADVD